MYQLFHHPGSAPQESHETFFIHSFDLRSTESSPPARFGIKSLRRHQGPEYQIKVPTVYVSLPQTRNNITIGLSNKATTNFLQQCLLIKQLRLFRVLPISYPTYLILSSFISKYCELNLF